MNCPACRKPILGNSYINVIRKGKPDQRMHIKCGLGLLPEQPRFDATLEKVIERNKEALTDLAKR